MAPHINLHLDLPVHLLSDSDGELCDYRAAIAEEHTGLKREDFASFIKAQERIFEYWGVFLAYELPAAGRTPKTGYWVEFDIDLGLIPKTLETPLRPEDIAAWHNSFMLFAPALAHLVRGVTAIEARDVTLHCVYDPPNAGLIAAFVPVAEMDKLDTIADLLWRNGIPFPPSHHRRIAAASELTFRICDANFPKEILPPTFSIL